MGVRLNSVVSNTIVNTTIVTTAETVVVTSPPFNPPLDNATVIILAYALVLAGTSTANMTARLRRGTAVTGTLVQATQAIFGTSAGLTFGCNCWYFDGPGVVAGQQYSLTLVMGSASTNSTVSDVAMLVFAL